MTIRILVGDCRRTLAQLPAASAHCCVTSPPYWGLRDYGTATWEGGDPACDHRSPTMREGRNEDRRLLDGSPATNSGQLLRYAHAACGKCGAVRRDQQIGLEATPEEFIDSLVRVFREVHRVLRPDGTLWLNLGDSYFSDGGHTDGDCLDRRGEYNIGRRPMDNYRAHRKRVGAGAGLGLKPKDLCLMPHRVAMALQADGWWVRSTVVWHKPNPMPESAKDRPTTAHEYVFLLSKGERYYYDWEAIQEPLKAPEASTPEDVARAFSRRRDQAPGSAQGPRKPAGEVPTHRNKRSVWTVSTKPFQGAHFATFPPDLIEPCIKAGCPKGGVVLDPFGGAGTTGLVADRLGRDALLLELNPEYAEMARERLQADGGLVTQVEVLEAGKVAA